MLSRNTMIYVLKNPDAFTRAVVAQEPDARPGWEAMEESEFIAWRDAQPDLVAPDTQPYRVSKDTLISRVLDAGMIDHVMTALESQSPAQQFIFEHSAWFWSNNATLRGLCASLGMDADVVLARDPYIS